MKGSLSLDFRIGSGRESDLKAKRRRRRENGVCVLGIGEWLREVWIGVKKKMIDAFWRSNR